MLDYKRYVFDYCLDYNVPTKRHVLCAENINTPITPGCMWPGPGSLFTKILSWFLWKSFSIFCHFSFVFLYFSLDRQSVLTSSFKNFVLIFVKGIFFLLSFLFVFLYFSFEGLSVLISSFKNFVLIFVKEIFFLLLFLFFLFFLFFIFF